MSRKSKHNGCPLENILQACQCRMRPSRIQGSPVRNKLYTRGDKASDPVLKNAGSVGAADFHYFNVFALVFSKLLFIASSVFILLLPKFIKKRQYFFRHVLFKNFNGATGMNQHIIPILAETSLIFASQMFPRTSTFAVSR